MLHWYFYLFQLCAVVVMIRSTMAQMVDPSQLPPALQKFFLRISANLNAILYPPNSSVAETDPPLFQALTKLHNASMPVLNIISNRTIPNNTWLTYNSIQEFNRIGLNVLDLLFVRMLTPEKIPLDMELDAMKDVVDYLDLPGESIDAELGKEVQVIVNEILEKFTGRRLKTYEVIGINSTLSDAQSRSNYILVFAGLRALSPKSFHATMIHEIAHGELTHIPKGTVARVFNDLLWSPISPQVPGLMSQINTSATLTATQMEAAKMLPLLVAAALSRTHELAADAFAIHMGTTRFRNPCGMIDAIRTFKQDHESLPFASHPNLKDRLEAALKRVAEEKAGPCSSTAIKSQCTSAFLIFIMIFYKNFRIDI